MEKITELLNRLEDLGKYIPKLDKLMGWVHWLVSFAVRVGPLCILILGLIYLLIPPKEANRKAGYRTYFGMGSIMAWRFTQRVAGILMTLVGLILFLAARSAVAKFSGMDSMEMAKTAFAVIKVQVICALVIYIFMFLLTAVLFNRKGDCRFSTEPGTLMGKLMPKVKEEMLPVPEAKKPKKQKAKKQKKSRREQSAEEPVEEYIPEETPVVEYERQGEQVITAHDIVIEGLDE